MGFVEAIASALRGYANFRDRARLSEYWWFILFGMLGSLVIGLAESAVGIDPDGGFFSTVFSLAILLPSLAVGARRLHDIDRSGWWLLLWFVPLVGMIVLIVWACKRGTPGFNRFGPDPLSGRRAAPRRDS